MWGREEYRIMSYCRFGEADAYIYDDIQYGLYCCACSLMPSTTAYNTFFKKELTTHEGFKANYDYDKMLAHIAEHRNKGDHVPQDVDDSLIFERDCTHAYNSEGICTICYRREKI